MLGSKVLEAMLVIMCMRFMCVTLFVWIVVIVVKRFNLIVDVNVFDMNNSKYTNIQNTYGHVSIHQLFFLNLSQLNRWIVYWNFKYEVEAILRTTDWLSISIPLIHKINSIYQKTIQAVNVEFALSSVHANYRSETVNFMV